MTKADTITALVHHATRVFAEKGYGIASLRAITQAADLPLATVHNYFASKDELYMAVLEACMASVNGERHALLQAARANGPLTPAAVIDAAVDPVARLWTVPNDENRYAVLLIRQLGGAPSHLATAIQSRFLDATAQRFVEALREACPSFSVEQAAHAYMFIVSCTYHALAQHERLARIAAATDDQEHMARLVTDLKQFCARAIGAPA